MSQKVFKIFFTQPLRTFILSFLGVKYNAVTPNKMKRFSKLLTIIAGELFHPRLFLNHIVIIPPSFFLLGFPEIQGI
jgi:hypothetical protein